MTDGISLEEYLIKLYGMKELKRGVEDDKQHKATERKEIRDIKA